MNCDHCGRQSDKLPYTCKWCGNSFCVTHRLPESHDCIGLKVTKAEQYLKQEYGDYSDVQPWFRDAYSNESQKVSDKYRESRTSHSCEICSKPLFEHEAWKCPSCSGIVCEKHLNEHRSTCSEGTKSGESNDAVQNWKQQGKPDTSSEETRRRPRSEEVKRAAQEVEEKLSPDYEPAPDVALDGSVVRSDEDEEEDEIEEDLRPRGGWHPSAIILIFAAVIILIFVIWVQYL